MTKLKQVIIPNRYKVVPRTILFIFNNGQVLLQKGATSKKIYAGLWNGLGGHIEKGEDVLTAAKRELVEEAGIECNDLLLNGTVMIDVNHDEGILLFVFSGHKFQGKLMPSDEGELKWFRIDELPHNQVVEDVPDLINRIIQSKKNNAWFHLLYTDGGMETEKSN